MALTENDLLLLKYAGVKAEDFEKKNEKDQAKNDVFARRPGKGERGR